MTDTLESLQAQRDEYEGRRKGNESAIATIDRRIAALRKPLVTRERIVSALRHFGHDKICDTINGVPIETFAASMAGFINAGAVPEPPKPAPDRGATLAALEALGVTDPTDASAFADQFGAVDDDPYIGPMDPDEPPKPAVSREAILGALEHPDCCLIFRTQTQRDDLASYLADKLGVKGTRP